MWNSPGYTGSVKHFVAVRNEASAEYCCLSIFARCFSFPSVVARHCSSGGVGLTCCRLAVSRAEAGGGGGALGLNPWYSQILETVRYRPIFPCHFSLGNLISLWEGCRRWYLGYGGLGRRGGEEEQGTSSLTSCHVELEGRGEAHVISGKKRDIE